MRIALSLLVCISLVPMMLAGCGGGSGNTVLPAAQYFPLAQSNQWRYQVTDYTVDSAGLSSHPARPRHLAGGLLIRSAPVRTAQDDTPGVSVLTVYLSGLKPIAGANWFEAVTLQPGLDTETIYYRHDANGLLVRATDEDDSYYLIRRPLEVGQSWTVPFATDCRLQIMALGETVETVAGSFENCLRVDETGTWESAPYRTESWFAPNVGFVSTTVNYDGQIEVGAELLDYDLR